MTTSSQKILAPYIPWTSGGDSWEELVHELLRIHHGHASYQRVPSVLGGDHGVDGFTYNGFAYQCYACDEPTSVKARSEHQKKKITTDSQKFIVNSRKLAALFQTIKITRWTLVVPLHDSADVVSHAASRTAIVRNANLSYVDSKNFHIHIMQLGDFAAELSTYGLSRPGAYMAAIHPIDEAVLQQFLASQSVYIANARRKLEASYRGANAEDLGNTLVHQVSNYLESENLMHSLRRDNPEYWNRVNKFRQLLNDELGYNGPQAGSPAYLKARFDEFSQRLREQASFLSEEHLSLLVRGTLTYALMSCSLDFIQP